MPVPSKLRWKCRRGMREMDILCTRFVEQHYEGLDDAERVALDQLLECPDQDILAWLTGDTMPEDAALANIIERMRGTMSPR